ARRHRDAHALEIARVGVPFRDVDARHVADVQPIAVELERRPETDAHAERVAVEAARRLDVVADHEVVLELRKRHDFIHRITPAQSTILQARYNPDISEST